MSYIAKWMVFLAINSLLLIGCAVYSIHETSETFDAAGNVISRQENSARAVVANSSDEVAFTLESDAKDITFGKTNTGGDVQVEALKEAAGALTCLASPAACLAGDQ